MHDMKMARLIGCVALLFWGLPAASEQRLVHLETGGGDRVHVADLNVQPDGSYSVDMRGEPFTDHFLSMRPFKCVEGADKHWCHLPYPYEIARNISTNLIDLEYDFLFIWKESTEYGINFWNGVYYRLAGENGILLGKAFDMDMNQLAVPPAAGELRPVQEKDLHEADPDSHLYPRLVIE